MKRVQGTYLAIPESVAFCRLVTLTAKMLWGYIRRREGPAMPAYVSYRRMVEDLDIPRRTVIVAMSLLEHTGRGGRMLVHKGVGVGRGHVNWYCTHTPEECGLCTHCQEKGCTARTL